MYQRLFI